MMLIAHLKQLLGQARRAPEAGPLGSPQVWQTASGIEVAAVEAESARRRELIDAWKARRRSRATPLLLLVERASDLFAVGPEGLEPEPVEVLPQLLDSLDFLLDGSDREAAVQRLQALLGELAAHPDTTPGVRPAGLFTPHFLFERLPRTRFWETLRDEAPADAPSDWRALLEGLSYELETLGEGFIAKANGEAIAVVRAEESPERLDAPLSDIHDLPYRRLGELMREHRLDNGLLVSGPVLRLFAHERPPERLPDRYLEFRLDRLEGRERPYLAILAPSTLGEDSGIKRLLVEARQFGAGLREGLERQIRDQALPAIVAGLTEDMDQERLADPLVRGRVMDAAFTLLFRLVFLLYCESADYLPVRSDRYRPHSLTEFCREARRDWPDAFDPDAEGIWHGVLGLASAMRTGNTGWGVASYNGALFAAEGFPGAELLEEATLTDEHLGRALVAIGYDLAENDPDAPGVDWAGLGVAHVGSIYENLLHLRLSFATENMRYDETEDRYLLAKPGEEVTQPAGSVFLQTERGGRKAGGVYYTQELFVEHLVEGAVGPVLADHLGNVRELARRDHEAALRLLFDFRVCDPAMGSGHFLVGALDFLAAELGAFLRECPLEALDRELEALREGADVGEAMPPTDRELLRRLLVKHCVYGVDKSAMAVELAKISLWLASFVPGLPLSVLDRNLVCGDSLVGVDRSARVHEQVGPLIWTQIEEPLERAKEKAAEAAEHADLSLPQVRESEAAVDEAARAARRVSRVYDAVTASGFDRALGGAILGDTGVLETLLRGPSDVASNGLPPEVAKLDKLSGDQRFLHWPLAFPEVFERENPGFDAVVGNPPWNEVTVERTGFFIQHDAGLGSVRTAAEREKRIERLLKRFPYLEEEYQRALAEAEQLRSFLRSPDAGYALQGRGDLDLYEAFLERYTTLLREGGGLGVVLPRSAFYVDGTVELRRWLFEHTSSHGIVFLLNDRRWAFDMEPRYTVALLVARRDPPSEGDTLQQSGPHRNQLEFEARTPITVQRAALARWTRSSGEAGAPTWEVPLLRADAERDLWDRLMELPRFDEGRRGDWRAFASREFDVTNDRAFIRRAGAWEVWTGGTFEQLLPWSGAIAGYCDPVDGCERLERKRQRSRVWRREWPEALRDPATLPPRTFRIAFRDVARATDSQTVIACVVPPQTFVTNKAPYLAFPEGGARGLAHLLGVLNSLPFNWQARRLVEISLNYFVLYFLRVPELPLADVRAQRIGELAARLNSVDDRYQPWAEAIGIECGPLSDVERLECRAELEAEAAKAYGLSADDLELVFSDFTDRALSPDLRAAIRARL
jgi:hypothetical protein